MSDELIYGDVIGRQISTGRPRVFSASSIPRTWRRRIASPTLASSGRSVTLRISTPLAATGRVVVDRNTGVQYVHATHDPFASPHPEEDTIECFLVHSGWRRFLRPRDAHDPAQAGVGLYEATIGGQIQQDWRRRPCWSTRPATSCLRD